MMSEDFWVSADRKDGGTVHSLDDASVAAILTAKAEEAEADGLKNSAAGIREALAKAPDEARSYLAMMRVIGGAAKRLKAGSK